MGILAEAPRLTILPMLAIVSERETTEDESLRSAQPAIAQSAPSGAYSRRTARPALERHFQPRIIPTIVLHPACR